MCYLTCHDYSSLVEGESHCILLLLLYKHKQNLFMVYKKYDVSLTITWKSGQSPFRLQVGMQDP